MSEFWNGIGCGFFSGMATLLTIQYIWERYRWRRYEQQQKLEKYGRGWVEPKPPPNYPLDGYGQEPIKHLKRPIGGPKSQNEDF